MSDFKLVLIDPNAPLYLEWREQFADLPDVEIVHGYFEQLPTFDCMVSPANSFGLMDGGVDAAITRFFGEALMRRVQQHIIEEFLGEQPVGTSFIVETGHARHPFLAHTPTMRVPMPISRTDNVYTAMWAMLLAVRRHNLQNDRRIEIVACPGLGTGVGQVPFAEAARQMALAYRHFLDPPKRLGWPFATKRQEAIRVGGDLGLMGHPGQDPRTVTVCEVIMTLERISLESSFQTRWECNNRISAYVAHCSGEPRAGILLLHGYTMDKEKLKYDALEMAEAGYTVLVPDLPLHGERALSEMGVFKYPYYGDPEGIPKLFENAQADIEACAAYLRGLIGPATPLCLTGFSLGGCLTILAMARNPGAFAMGVSVVGSAQIARLFFTSAITSDIRNDPVSLGFNQESWRSVVRPIEATEHSKGIQNLLMIGVEDDDIVPVALVQDTFATLEQTSNECVIFETYGHFTPMPLVSAHALPFFERRLSS